MTPLATRLRLRIDVLLDERESQRLQIKRLQFRVDALMAERELLRRELRSERTAHERTQIVNRIRETENARLRRLLRRKPLAEVAA